MRKINTNVINKQSPIVLNNQYQNGANIQISDILNNSIHSYRDWNTRESDSSIKKIQNLRHLDANIYSYNQEFNVNDHSNLNIHDASDSVMLQRQSNMNRGVGFRTADGNSKKSSNNDSHIIK